MQSRLWKTPRDGQKWSSLSGQAKGPAGTMVAAAKYILSKLAFCLSDVLMDASSPLSAGSVLVPTTTSLPALHSMAPLFVPI